MAKKRIDAYWSKPAKDLLAKLSTSESGLSDAEAARRLAAAGPNTIAAREKTPGLHLLLSQFKNPLVLILLFATAVSFAVGEQFGAVITPRVPPPTTMILLLFFIVEFFA